MIRTRIPRLARLVLAAAALPMAALPAKGACVELPEGPGLAAEYPGDEGLGDDPAVVVFEDFDAESLEEVLERWDQASNEGGSVLELAKDQPEALGGGDGRSLKITATPGESTGGHLYTRLPRELETAYLRFYVKFPDPPNYIHHFVHLGGYNPPTPWPQGGAGSRPEGHERVTVGIEPTGRNGREPAPGVWNFYTYWHEMKKSADGRYWGNGLHTPRRQPVPVERWQCVEAMMRLNTPGERDGALALWLDGELVADIRQGTPRGPWTGLGFEVLERGGEPFEGFDFRTSEELRINFLWLLHYVTESSNRRNRAADTERPNAVWFDQVVVATRYIGPIAPR